MPEKLYVVVKDDLPPGQQLAQACHAAFQIGVMFNRDIAEWFRRSNYLVVLAASDINEVRRHVCAKDEVADRKHTRYGIVTEPDLPGCPQTAIAFLPDQPWVGQALSSLPLALKEAAWS